MDLVSNIDESIQRMGCTENDSNYIVQFQHIASLNDAYWSSSKDNFIPLMLNHNDLCPGLDYMVDTPLYLALKCRYDIDSTNVFNLLSARINSEALAHPIGYDSKRSSMHHWSGLYHSRYINWVTLMSAEYTEVSH
jgi:hypothetical protein